MCSLSGVRPDTVPSLPMTQDILEVSCPHCGTTGPHQPHLRQDKL
jgi:hypothetical protein